MKPLKPIIVVAAAIAVVLVAHHFIRRSEPQQRRGGGDTAVVAEVVGTRTFANSTESIGTVSANESVTVTPPVTERIASVHFNDGAFVRQGDVLVELEHAEESAAFEEARIAVAEQERQFERVETLRRSDLVSQEEFDLARDSLDAAKARAAATEARLNDRVITAPFAGVVGIRRASPGALVSPGSVITTLDDLSVVKVDFSVSESLLSEVAVGQAIEGRATSWPDETFSGKVTSIDSRISSSTRAIAMQARVPNPDGKLRAGMLLTLELTCCPREAPGIPEKALLSYADRQYVYVVREDQTVEQREVVLGKRDVGWVEVIDGLTPGETIVVDGLLNLRDGASVRLEQTTS